ncbi:MAG TPA: aldo/keto reductase [Pseudolysinimonas sp.]|nr:aldo/keto reductase [Pseudolysinimonas sp.]
MENRPLGTAPFTVSAVGLGCNNFGRTGTATFTAEGTAQVVDAALDAGVRFFDTADVYGAEYGLSETLLGAAMAGRRDRIIVATKFGHTEAATPIGDAGPRGSRAYIRAAVEGSLRRLQTDRIDLYQQHTPDPSVPIEETLGALNELVDEGKVVAIGNSNFDAAQLTAAAAAADRLGTAAFVSAQNQYNLLDRSAERELLPAARAAGVGFLPFFPLANGLFTGKFTRTQRPADSRIARQRPQVADEAPWDAIEAYADFCAARGISMLEATFGWLLAQPGLASVIAGATRPEQITANAAAGEGWRPDAAELAAIDALFPIAAE